MTDTPQPTSPESVPLEELTNQTQFASEEPLFQDVSSPLEETEEAQAHQQQLARERKRLTLIVSGVVAFLVLLIVTAAVLMPKHMITKKVVVTSPSPTMTAQESQLQQQLDVVDTNLKNADPSKLDLPFPPVNLSLSLDNTR